MMSVLVAVAGFWAGCVVIALTWLWYESHKPVSEMDRKLDRMDRALDAREHDPGLEAIQAGVNELGAASDGAWRDRPIRNTPGGWRA